MEALAISGIFASLVGIRLIAGCLERQRTMRLPWAAAEGAAIILSLLNLGLQLDLFSGPIWGGGAWILVLLGLLGTGALALGATRVLVLQEGAAAKLSSLWPFLPGFGMVALSPFLLAWRMSLAIAALNLVCGSLGIWLLLARYRGPAQTLASGSKPPKPAQRTLKLDPPDLSGQAIDQFRLSEREKEIVDLLNQGLANKEIAFRLKLKSVTIKNHVYNIYQKTGVKGRVELLNACRGQQVQADQE